MACEEYKGFSPANDDKSHTPLRIGDWPFAKRSVMELAKQGSGRGGVLRKLAGLGRRAPLSPEAFAGLIATKQFTSGARPPASVTLASPATLTATLAAAPLGRRCRLEDGH